MAPATSAQLEEIVNRQVFAGEANRRFGELTPADAKMQADQLRMAVGWGPTARVAPVARAWRELALTMERKGVATVGELDPETLMELAPKLWILPPGGSLL